MSFKFFSDEEVQKLFEQVINGTMNNRQSFRTNSREAAIESARSAMFEMRDSRKREVMRRIYVEMGFEIDARGILNSLPFIDVVATVAKVDPDFYAK